MDGSEPLFTSWAQVVLFFGLLAIVSERIYRLVKDKKAPNANGAANLGFKDAVAMTTSIRDHVDRVERSVNENVDGTRHSVNEGLQRVIGALHDEFEDHTNRIVGKLDSIEKAITGRKK